MTLRERVRAHLVREARQRAREALGKRARTADVAKAMAAAEREVLDWHVRWHIENANAKAAQCELIVSRHGADLPEDTRRQIAERAKWHREVAEEARRGRAA